MALSTVIKDLLAAGQPTFFIEQQQGGDRVSYPLGEIEPTARVVSADFMIDTASYVRPVSNTRRPNDNALVFITDSELRDKGAGLSAFTRTWATRPAVHYEYDEIGYNYPAYVSGSTFRKATTFVVTRRTTFLYAIIPQGQDPSSTLGWTAGTVINYGLDGDGNPYSALGGGSSPTVADYLTAVATDAGTPSSYSLQPEDSTIQQYLGNIWVKKTPAIKYK